MYDCSNRSSEVKIPIKPTQTYIVLFVNEQEQSLKPCFMLLRQLRATCANDLHVALGSNALFVHADSVDLVLLPAGQPRYLAGGAAAVARPPATLRVLSHCHVGDGAL